MYTDDWFDTCDFGMDRCFSRFIFTLQIWAFHTQASDKLNLCSSNGVGKVKANDGTNVLD